MMKKGILRVATCQFAVGGHINRNAAQILKQIDQAKKRRADVVHFPESALTGYPGTDITSWDGFDWDILRTQTQAICEHAARRKVWVVLGSAHRLAAPRLPHNCLYLISPSGKIVNRYDKRFCMTNDFSYYTPGDHPVVFTLNGVRCALLICFDLRFPELYRQLVTHRVQCVFQSFYNARAPGADRSSPHHAPNDAGPRPPRMRFGLAAPTPAATTSHTPVSSSSRTARSSRRQNNTARRCVSTKSMSTKPSTTRPSRIAPPPSPGR